MKKRGATLIIKASVTLATSLVVLGQLALSSVHVDLRITHINKVIVQEPPKRKNVVVKKKIFETTLGSEYLEVTPSRMRPHH